METANLKNRLRAVMYSSVLKKESKKNWWTVPWHKTFGLTFSMQQINLQNF